MRSHLLSTTHPPASPSLSRPPRKEVPVSRQALPLARYGGNGLDLVCSRSPDRKKVMLPHRNFLLKP